jgi:tetratricopeptide (TPR) repeat protein
MDIQIKEIRHIDRRLRELYDRGLQAYNQKNFSYAIEMFRTVLRAEPGLLEVREKLREAQVGKIGGKSNFFTRGIASILSIPNMIKHPILCSKEKYSEALDNGEAAMSRDPSAMANCYLLAKAAERVADAASEEGGASDGAGILKIGINALECALKFHPKNVSLLERMTHIYVDAGRGTRALECALQMRTLQPNNTKWAELAKEMGAAAAMEKDRWQEAAEGKVNYQELVRDKDQMKSLEEGARTFQHADDLAPRILQLEEIIRTQDTIANRKKLAETYVQVRNWDKALENYERINELAGSFDSSVDEAITKVLCHQFNDAIYEWEDYMEAEELSEEEIQNAEEQVAIIVDQKRDMQIEHLGERVRRNPNNTPARFELSNLQLEAGFVDEALSNFQHVQKNPQFRQQANLAMGKCFMAKKQFDLAVDQLTGALQTMPSMNGTKKDTYYTLAQCYEQLGKRKEAIECYKTIYSVDLNYRDISDVIERIYREDKEEEDGAASVA